MKIYSGNLEVLASGILSSPDLSDTRFVVSEDPQMEVVFRISMKGNETGINIEVIDENTLALVFTKPKGLAYGPVKPVRVGLLNGRVLYVNFRVSVRGEEESYGLEYTFYLKEAECELKPE